MSESLSEDQADNGIANLQTLVNAFRAHYLRFEGLVNDLCTPATSEFVLSRLKDDLNEFIGLTNEYETIFEQQEFDNIRTNLALMYGHTETHHHSALERSHEGRPVLVELVHPDGRGRPSYQIDRDFLAWAYTLRSTSAIARFLGVGRTVVRDALLAYGIAEPQTNPFRAAPPQNDHDMPDIPLHDDILEPEEPIPTDIPADVPRPQSYTAPQSTISDFDLEKIVLQLRSHFPRAGINMMDGMLRRLGYRIPRERVRLALIAIDPVRRVFERITIRRRIYSVPGPNSLWHHDGQHRLIRWNIVIHGFIDGYSRMITGLKASNNNHGETVLNLFLGATDTYGVPSRLRGDHGIENLLVAAWMEAHRGPRRGSYLWGRSVHNVRIERLWVDVTVQVGENWHATFVTLELEHNLDVNNPSHIWLLHHLFLKIINEQLTFFAEAWNAHKIQMRHGPNRSPIDMFGFDMYVHGVRGGFTADDDLEPLSSDEQEVFGVDWEAFHSDSVMRARLHNNSASEAASSWLGRTGPPPPEELGGVELNEPIGPLSSGERDTFNAHFGHWISLNPNASASDMWIQGLALSRAFFPGRF